MTSPRHPLQHTHGCNRDVGEGVRLRHTVVSLADANAFVGIFHRHHAPVIGHKFSIAAVRGNELVGVVIVGRPVSRMRDDGATLEVTRLCTDGTKNACSFLYGAAAKAAFALGYDRIGTYTLPSEGGGSLRATDWKLIGERGGGSWNCESRPRSDKHPTEPKLLWEKTRPGALRICTCRSGGCRHLTDRLCAEAVLTEVAASASAEVDMEDHILHRTVEGSEGVFRGHRKAV